MFSPSYVFMDVFHLNVGCWAVVDIQPSLLKLKVAARFIFVYAELKKHKTQRYMFLNKSICLCIHRHTLRLNIIPLPRNICYFSLTHFNCKIQDVLFVHSKQEKNSKHTAALIIPMAVFHR